MLITVGSFRSLRTYATLLQTSRCFSGFDKSGLFGLEVNASEDWQSLAVQTKRRCQELVQDVRGADSSATVIHQMDDISDTVCQTYDSALLCSSAHASSTWRQAATDAMQWLSGYIQELNMDARLRDSLASAMRRHDELAAKDTPETIEQLRAAGFTEEASLVGLRLLQEFEKYGSGLPPQQQQRALDLTTQEHSLRNSFGQVLRDARHLGHVALSRVEAAGLSTEVNGLASATGQVQMPLTPTLVSWVLRHSADDALRQKVYMASMHSPHANVANLCSLVQSRHDLALTMGQPSFAHLQLKDFTLAKSPEAVHGFLDNLSAALVPQVDEAMHELRRHAISHQPRQTPDHDIQPWDLDFYLQIAKTARQNAEHSSAANFMTFPLSAMIQGLAALTRDLFHVDMQEIDFNSGEAWADGCSKLRCTHRGELLGTMYLDLFRRPAKFGGAAHFTLRCARQLSDGSHQTPIVALVCNLGSSEGPDRQLQLMHHEVETLFHEYGHALSSLLSRTAFQHLSGTRGSFDIVEVASHVMQLFARDPRVLARMCQPSQASVSSHHFEPMLRNSARFAALGIKEQVVESKVHQLLSGPAPPTSIQAMSHAICGIYSKHGVTALPAGCLPVLRSSHLVSYGSQYYAYLYAKCLAASIWERYFAEDPFNPDAGAIVRRELFEVGSARLPTDFVTKLLGAESLESLNGGWAPRPDVFLSKLDKYH